MNASVKFTVFSKSWTQSLPEMGRRLRALGFDGVELPIRPGFQVEPHAIARDLPLAVRILGDCGLRVGSVAAPTDVRTIEACANAGVPIIRTLVKVPHDGRYMDTMEKTLHEFNHLLPYLAQTGVKIGIQNHCHREVSSVMGIHYLVRRFDPKLVAAVLDVGHCGLAGETADLALDILWPYLCLVNFKNAFWKRIENPNSAVAEFDCHWTTGRDGMGHWPSFVAELNRRQYIGDICLSAEYSDAPRVEQLVADDLQFARALFLADAGVASAGTASQTSMNING